ncbi:MAG: c-type cytochrome, partial [Planctomycetes bacterium]|nr:c-type cytochrome [Planctomycetota bacterium]
PARPRGQPDLHLGQDVFRASCAACHGEGRGDGPLAASFKNAAGRATPPPDLTLGPDVLRGGATSEAIARTVALGRPGTLMGEISLPPDQLWAVAAYVRRLGEVGRSRRARAWNSFFAGWRPLEGVERAIASDPIERWNERLSARWAKAPRGRKGGCLACHQGLSQIATGAMQVALEAFGAGDPAGTCVVCHEGRSDALTKTEAHRGLIGNPGSLWATSVGAGCAKCHSAPGALQTLQGRRLPERVGGRLMHVRSRHNDPTGASSGNYTYRVQRSLMAQETGKVLLLTSSVDLVDPSQPRYTNYPVIDTDTAEPAVGSPAYRAVVARGLASGYLQRMERTAGLPTFREAVELCGGGPDALPRAALIDYGRKNCFRCHVWGEGKATRLEHRSSGCSACHVLSGENGTYEGKDRTIPKRRAGHASRHRLVTTPPDSQCNHCHTRNAYTEHSEPHQQAGLGCVDCHTSIDVHGDGNVYPSMEHQVEIRCEDCHGSGSSSPWDLPLGHGTPLAGEGARGVFSGEGGKAHLLTNRGNPRRNWVREGDQVVVESFLSGQRHLAPLLNTRRPATAPNQSGCSEGIAGHEKVSCALCHNRKAARCGSCHMDYDRARAGQDWLLSAQAYDEHSLRQREVFTPGTVTFKAERKGSVPFGPPDTRRDRANRWAPREPGCKVSLRYVKRGRTVARYVPRFNPGSPSYPPIVANSTPHENAIPPRTCSECHPAGTGPGKRALLFGDVQPDPGDWWRSPVERPPSQAAKARWRLR